LRVTKLPERTAWQEQQEQASDDVYTPPNVVTIASAGYHKHLNMRSLAAGWCTGGQQTAASAVAPAAVPLLLHTRLPRPCNAAHHGSTVSIIKTNHADWPRSPAAALLDMQCMQHLPACWFLQLYSAHCALLQQPMAKEEKGTIRFVDIVPTRSNSNYLQSKSLQFMLSVISLAAGALDSFATTQLHLLTATAALQTAQQPAAPLAQHKNSSSGSGSR
jgi:hypothetical protein